MTFTYISLKSLSARKISLLKPTKTAMAMKYLLSSLERDGLLNPLIVQEQNGRFFVVDGKKRLIALRQLAKQKLYRRALSKVPCIIVEKFDSKQWDWDRPQLMSEYELAHKVIVTSRLGVSEALIAKRFECRIDILRDCLSLRQLHPKLLMQFNNNVISLRQAAAFATIPNIDAQWSLLLQLGPFVSDKDIMDSVRNGETVIKLEEDNIIILPSRQKFESSKDLSFCEAA